MICLIQQIADYVIPKENKIRKGIGEIMGGNVITLPSDYIKEGFIEARRSTLSLIQKGKISLEDGAEESGMSIEEFKKAMLEAGYKIPTNA